MRILGAVVAVLALAGLSPVRADVITFDTGVAGNSIGAFYAGQGVTFTNGSFTSNFGLAGSSGPLGMNHTTSSFQPIASNPIIATFAAGQSSVSITGVDVGERGVRIDAYDAPVGGNLVDFDQAFGSGIGVGEFFTVSAAAGNIRRVEMYQPNNIASSDGMLFDTMEFQAANTPEPASLAVFGLSVLAVGRMVRRRRTV